MLVEARADGLAPPPRALLLLQEEEHPALHRVAVELCGCGVQGTALEPGVDDSNLIFFQAGWCLPSLPRALLLGEEERSPTPSHCSFSPRGCRTMYHTSNSKRTVRKNTSSSRKNTEGLSSCRFGRGVCGWGFGLQLS